tara:strand:+ start:1432 stop:1788 length:357 start_codon:yes stop_codon:yes gene_type:complete
MIVGRPRDGHVFVRVMDEDEEDEDEEENVSASSKRKRQEKKQGVLLKCTAKQVRAPRRDPGTVVGHEYCARNNETPAMIADALGVDVKQMVLLNNVVYSGLKKDSKLQTGTLLSVPRN